MTYHNKVGKVGKAKQFPYLTDETLTLVLALYWHVSFSKYSEHRSYLLFFSPGPAESLALLVQGGHAPVRRLQSTEARRLQSRCIGGRLPGSHMPEARVHRRLPHAGQWSSLDHHWIEQQNLIIIKLWYQLCKKCPTTNVLYSTIVKQFNVSAILNDVILQEVRSLLQHQVRMKLD